MTQAPFGRDSDIIDYWDREEDWESELKRGTLSQKAAEGRVNPEEDETLDAEDLKSEQDEALEIEDLERKLAILKSKKAIGRTIRKLATLREIVAAEQKRPLRYER